MLNNGWERERERELDLAADFREDRNIGAKFFGWFRLVGFVRDFCQKVELYCS